MSDTRKTTKPNVPNLRFPGFEGEWEKMKASDLLDFFSTNSLSWEQLEYGGVGLLNLHYGLIHNGLPTQIDINDSTLPGIKAGNEPRKFTLCKEGDIAFADASEDTNDVGKVVEFVDCAGKNVVCGLHTIHGRDKLDKTVPGFKGYVFSSKAFHDQIKRIAQGTKVFSISAGCFDEVSIGIPDKEEQKKIAALLSLIDQRISIQSKVIEKYESLIKALAHEIIGKNAPNTMLSECVCCTSSTLKESDLSDAERFQHTAQLGSPGLLIEPFLTEIRY
jgi:type I restriction enzyme S subunit